MPDRRYLALSHLAALLRLEKAFAAAVEQALAVLTRRVREQLRDRLDAAVLDARDPAWVAAVAKHIDPQVISVYVAGMRRLADEGTTLDAQPYAVRYLESVHDRLVGTAEAVFDTVREELVRGHRKGESIPELAARVDTALGDSERWAHRATVIARTEVIAANNAGAQDGAGALADRLGVDRALVVKEWLATPDDRTRETHRHAGGEQVLGLDSLFTVGAARMPVPGWPFAPADEVVQCRCSCLYLMPGDPGYPEGLTAGGTMPAPLLPRTSHRVLALTASGTPCADHPCVCRGCDEFDCGLDACLCCWMDDQSAAMILSPVHPDDDKMAALAAAAPLRIATFDVSRMPEKLQAYWLAGPGAAKIGYGGPGQFKRCQVALRGKVPGHMIDGTCANLIHKATGQWPGKHGQHSTGGLITASGPTYVGEVSPVLMRQEGGRLVAAGDTASPMVEPPPGAVPTDVPPAYDPEDEEPHTLAVVALLPAADEDVQGIGPEVKHATLLYLGEAAALADDDHTALATLLQEWAAQTPPETSAVTGLDHLGDDGALVWTLDDALAGLRDALAATPLVTRLLAAVEQFPDYLPHVTVGYPTDQGDTVDDTAWPAIEDAAGDVTAVRFDRVALWWADSRAEWPLTGDTGSPAADGAQSGTQQTEEAPVTAAAPEQTVGVDAATETELTWSGVLAPEGVRTGDKRKFSEGAIQWMGTPGVLKAMFTDQPGHDGSVPVGLIQGIERVDGRLVAHGTWDTGPAAVEARRQNIAGLLRGVSVDLDDPQSHMEDADGNVVDGDAMLGLTDEPTFVVDKARLRSATLWCIPAFVEAYVLDATVADQIPDTSIVSSTATPLAIAAAAAYTAEDLTADAAPSSAFADPGFDAPTKLTVTDDGRVFGHLACWGVCHIGIDGACVTPPHSATGYAYYLTGDYPTSDGQHVPVGALTLGTGHADLTLGWRPTVDHYDNTGTVAAYVNVGEDDHGIWFAGVLADDLPLPQRQALTRSGSVSGDWRAIGGNLELVANLGVNVPGFPIPATRSMAAAGAQQALVASGVVPVAPEPTGPVNVAELAREVAAFQARQTRREAAAARVRTHRRTAAVSRLAERK